MALQAGDAGATSGMSKSIYEAIDQQLSSALPPEALADVRPSWRKLAFAVATGVIDYLTSNAEVHGIQSTGTAAVTVRGLDNVTVIGSGTGTCQAAQSGPTIGHLT